jgi:serine/threonine-protein kinase
MAAPTRACPTCNTPLPGVAAFCYVCGTATPIGINRETGERVAVTQSSMTAAGLKKALQRALGPGYELGERIGAGGFAEVFRARDLRLKRDIAVKVLRPDLGLTPGMLERFRREAETVAALRHPNIVPIYDVGEQKGIAYIVMPLIEGESLRARMERDGAMPVAEVRRILTEAASGLAAAHDAGVIHRDIKPENIMLEGREARALLMDFGIAKAVGGEEDTPLTEEGVAPALTSTGIIVGTPQYMSPEQACGDKSIDARTDQYSLAVVGYRMLAGTLPFEGDSTRAVLYKQLVAEPPPLETKIPDVPPGISAAILRAMQKEPAERFPSMVEFGEALRVDGETTLIAAATAPVAASVAAAQASSKRTLILAGVAVIAVGALLLRGGFVLPDAPVDTGIVAAADPFAAPGTAPVATADGDRPPAVATASPPQNPGASPSRTGRTPPAATGTAAPRTAATGPAATAPTCAALLGAGNFEAAATTCLAEAEAGTVSSMRLLAGMYDRGNGVKEDPAQALTWYRRAAPNDAEAKFQVSDMLEKGRGAPRDARAALTALREAAAMGHQQATLTLAFRLETGGGINRDYEEAAIWYGRAAERGHVPSMLKLGEWHARGRGVPKDEAKALAWYRRAAEGGSAQGAWETAQAYLRGRGTTANEAEGVTWLRKAADLGSSEAAAELKKRDG